MRWIRMNEHVQMCANVTFVVNCKGIHDPLCSNSLQNVGQECFSILNYITEVYEKTRCCHHEILFHIPASLLHSKDRREKYNEILSTTLKEKHGNITYIDVARRREIEREAEFVMRGWKGSMSNRTLELTPAVKEPFKEWYRFHFGEPLPHIVTWSRGMFALNTKQIYRYPLSLYEALKNETSMGVATEVCHYLERSWYPMWNWWNAYFLFVVTLERKQNLTKLESIAPNPAADQDAAEQLCATDYLDK